MLVLSRKLNESIRIADEITVTVLEVRGNRVRLGITAPRHINIARTMEFAEPGETPREHSHLSSMVRQHREARVAARVG